MNRFETYALITGGGTGIGRAIAFELAKKGYNIALIALPNSGLTETKELLEQQFNIDVRYLEIDLTEIDAILAISKWINSEKIGIQILVNNAGMGFAKPFTDLSYTYISALLDVNIKCSTLLTHTVLPELKKRHKAYILNISSAAAFYSMPYKSIYAASKRYLMDFSMALREELKPDDINVTAVCPAGVITSTEIKERIEKSGTLAKKSALEPSQVAKEAVNALFKNKPYIIPGRLARMISSARYFLPASWQRVAIGKSFKNKTT